MKLFGDFSFLALLSPESYNFFLWKLKQANVIKSSVDLEVGIYCGSSNNLKSVNNRVKEIAEHEVG